MGVVVLEFVALFFFHQTKEDELKDAQGRVNEVVSQIGELKAKVKDHDEIKAQLAVLRAREDAISKLESARSGPTAVLLELSRLLTKGQGPTADAKKLQKLREENPLNVYNPAWDPKRLWILHYSETERSVRLEGIARDGGDVYEFSQRLKLSSYFDQVTLLPGQRNKKNADGVDLVSFALQVKVRY
jgi:type IV pilus assembly protein PilN